MIPTNATRDGRVGFIDFGIVGKISKTTWQAVEAIAVALPSRDYDTLAKALVQVHIHTLKSNARDENKNSSAYSGNQNSLFSSTLSLVGRLEQLVLRLM